MMDDLKGFLTGIVSRWLLKIGGGVLLTLGYETDEIPVVIGGAAAIAVGIVISIAQHLAAKRSDPAVPGPAPKAAPLESDATRRP